MTEPPLNTNPIQDRNRAAAVKRLNGMIERFAARVAEMEGAETPRERRSLTIAKRCLSARRRELERVLARPTLVRKSRGSKTARAASTEGNGNA